MEEPILITWLNDFQFCPASIYFHNLYGTVDSLSFQETSQINGSAAHTTIDEQTYSTRSDVITATTVFCEEYGLIGKIDIFDIGTGELIERKKKVTTVFDGYILQLYGQCFALREMGYTVKKLTIRSLSDNRQYGVELPEDDAEMMGKFRDTILQLRTLDLSMFRQQNKEKCEHCIYEPLCDRAL